MPVMLSSWREEEEEDGGVMRSIDGGFLRLLLPPSHLFPHLHAEEEAGGELWSWCTRVEEGRGSMSEELE